MGRKNEKKVLSKELARGLLTETEGSRAATFTRSSENTLFFLIYIFMLKASRPTNYDNPYVAS